MKVQVSAPVMGQLEKAYVNQALDSNAISGLFGEFIERFEERFANYCDTKHGVSCSNGTTALHLALVAAGVKEGDEVLVSTLTNMATFFAVLYLKAIPIPVDINLDTLTIDPVDLAKKISTKSKAIMVVHLFGHPADMDPINELACENNLIVIEDCAEAHGALYKGRKVGSLGDVGCFSFFANKILTTGEGGMLTTNSADIAIKARSLKALAFGTTNKFMHDDIGYNYRLTNIQAAIGCAQTEQAEKLVNRRIEISHFYSSRLERYRKFFNLPIQKDYAKCVYWMYHIVLRDDYVSYRLKIMESLKSFGIETREGFIPYNLQDIFIKRGWTKPSDCPNAARVAYASFYLPTGPAVTDIELDYVCSKLCSIFDEIAV